MSESSLACSGDDESEMMPVLLASLSEGRVIDVIAVRAEHPGRITIRPSRRK
jgi:hypothetical protein